MALSRPHHHHHHSKHSKQSSLGVGRGHFSPPQGRGEPQRPQQHQQQQRQGPPVSSHPRPSARLQTCRVQRTRQQVGGHRRFRRVHNGRKYRPCRRRESAHVEQGRVDSRGGGASKLGRRLGCSVALCERRCFAATPSLSGLPRPSAVCRRIPCFARVRLGGRPEPCSDKPQGLVGHYDALRENVFGFV